MVADSRSGQVDDGVEAGDVAGCQAPRGRVPPDFAVARDPAHDANDLMAVALELLPERRTDEAGRSADANSQ
jgi:hypothetical protein